MLSLSVTDREWSEPGTKVTVVWGEPGELQKEIRATVERAPYKRDNRRADFSDL
jgi:vanillate/3-O-methylgallate O-demethylase